MARHIYIHQATRDIAAINFDRLQSLIKNGQMEAITDLRRSSPNASYGTQEVRSTTNGRRFTLQVENIPATFKDARARDAKFSGYVSERLSGGYKLMEGIGPNGGEWAIVKGDHVEWKGNSKREALQEFGRWGVSDAQQLFESLIEWRDAVMARYPQARIVLKVGGGGGAKALMYRDMLVGKFENGRGVVYEKPQ